MEANYCFLRTNTRETPCTPNLLLDFTLKSPLQKELALNVSVLIYQKEEECNIKMLLHFYSEAPNKFSHTPKPTHTLGSYSGTQ